MVSKNRSSLQVEPLEGRRMLSVTPAAGQEYGVYINTNLAAGVNIGEVCRVEKGSCATDSLVFLHPPGQA